MTPDDPQELLKVELVQLRSEHRRLDAQIEEHVAVGLGSLEVQRLKKRKLALKDRITRIEDELYPDIIA
ncbi:DUF465 domain-containing protein [Paralimibaculum aggregatum]|uniref:DUF465 domain-containing protein n=1 Tax=Paralimibaculum aggregatum TaxID=3036245 RepID=A0ABQ6LI33_9RHOB|nr:DUF465 domain-containing protein [Limibaculum sp. NKW23]GMG82952.1 DUF465 domain-containing protein [Limibaculum sp. NKW23]